MIPAYGGNIIIITLDLTAHDNKGMPSRITYTALAINTKNKLYTTINNIEK